MTLPDKRRADVLAPATSQNVLPDRSNDTDLALEAQVAAPYSTLPGRRLPAYGRSVLTMREQGLAPAVAVLVVDGWAPISNPNEYAPWIVIVPDGEPATGFDFRCVAGLIALVIAERFERADEIAVEVLKSAPAGLYVWGDDVQATAFYLHELEAQQMTMDTPNTRAATSAEMTAYRALAAARRGYGATEAVERTMTNAAAPEALVGQSATANATADDPDGTRWPDAMDSGRAARHCG